MPSTKRKHWLLSFFAAIALCASVTVGAKLAPREPFRMSETSLRTSAQNPAVPAPAQVEDSVQNTTPCGIPLSAPVRDLLTQFERDSGKRVICKAQLNLLAERKQWARHKWINESPTIFLDTEQGQSEDEILHELLHLQIENKSGIWHVAAAPPDQIAEGILGRLNDAYDHAVMYPQMRMMGFDPDKKERMGTGIFQLQAELGC
jgi:hypothetical protein